MRDEIAQQLEEEARRCSERSGPVSRSSARVTRRLRSKARAEAEEEAERLGRRTDTGACSSGRGGGLGQCGAATRPCFSLTAAPRSLWRTAVAGRLMSDILTEEEVAEDLQAIHGDWVARSSTYCDSRACTPSQCTLWNALTLLSPPPLGAGDRGDVFAENGRLQIGELGFVVGSPVIVTSELTNEVFAGVLDKITPHEVRCSHGAARPRPRSPPPPPPVRASLPHRASPRSGAQVILRHGDGTRSRIYVAHIKLQRCTIRHDMSHMAPTMHPGRWT